MQLTRQQIRLFQEQVHQQGQELYRPMAWRDTPSPYYVVVSELMLQQTQVARVQVKFAEFIATFPTFEALAAATQDQVVALWTGLGYNRRARFLHQIAQHVAQHGVPKTQKEWQALPGIGENTAGAIMAYVYNEPVVYVETNIRTVVIHTFFQDALSVEEQQIQHIVAQTVDTEDARHWYWAMMDYGADLKARGYRYNGRMRTYKKQPALKGSVREVRGAIVALLGERHEVTLGELTERFDDRLEAALAGLKKDGIITQVKEIFSLTK